ncbi:hypothetical protein PROFUN_08712 [Planoprotostelium fungivorum]|uniref:Uncharacterized protein n=1 Tax=Planoprotostelium fungivorum TaxID=1890364 RepID=A0A2P6MQV8_9EUKA|nr:hypothetical protein PROFUN_08712 [Planoprotostelium fungivorum]
MFGSVESTEEQRYLQQLLTGTGIRISTPPSPTPSQRSKSIRKTSKVDEDSLKDWSIRELIRVNKEKDAALADLAAQIQKIKLSVQNLTQHKNKQLEQLRTKLKETQDSVAAQDETIHDNEKHYRNSLRTFQMTKDTEFKTYQALMVKMREQLRRVREGGTLSDEEEIDFIFEENEEEMDTPMSPNGERGSVVLHDVDSTNGSEEEDWTVEEEKSSKGKNESGEQKEAMNQEDWQQNYFANIALALKMNFARANDNRECGIDIQSLWDQCKAEKIDRSEWKKFITRKLEEHYKKVRGHP